MTPPSPETPEGSPLPPRHRPSLGNLAQDTTEGDLWAFDEDLDAPEEGEGAEEVPVLASSGKDIPAPRDRQPLKPREEDGSASQKTAPGEESIRMNINKVGVKNRPTGPVSGPATPESDFDDLENWDDVKLEPEIEDLPAVVEETIEPEVAVEPAVEARTAAEVESPPTPTAESESDDEFSPVFREDAAPVSLRPHLSLTKVERIGMIALAVLLLGGGATFFLSSLLNLPSGAVKAESNDFPIKGEHLTIKSALSYWRAPIRNGADADTFRRGTVLMPVLEVAVDGGPAAIRILFRSEDQTVIGDAVTRTIDGADKLVIPATAGFDDLGMHAAYRTGESKPWTIEVYEARSEDASGKNFKKLFEMNISTDRR